MITNKIFKNKKAIILKNTCTPLFFIFLFVYLSFSLFDFYFCDFVTSINHDVIYGLDIGAEFWCMYLKQNTPVLKHHFVQIFTYPIILLFKSFLMNPRLVAAILHPIIQSTVVCFIYKILLNLSNDKKLSLLFAILYGFSYAALLFSIFGDVYVWAGLSQTIFLCYFLHCYRNNLEKLEIKNIIILSFLSVLSYGINLINIVSCAILILFLVFKIYKKDWKKILANIAKITIIIGMIIAIFIQLQSYSLDYQKRRMGAKHLRFGYKNEKIVNTISGSLIEPFYALKSGKSNELYSQKNQDGTIVQIHRYISLKKQSPVRYLPAVCILLFPLIFYFRNSKKYKDRAIINLFLSVVGLYTLFNYPFYSYECALFALNYFPILIVTLGMLYKNVRPILRNLIIGLFIIYEMIINFKNLFKIHNFLIDASPDHHTFLTCLTMSATFTGLVALIYFASKYFVSKNNDAFLIKDSYLFWLFIYLLLVATYLICKLTVQITI